MKRGQQEIVGFILIVVLVVIGLMVFLVISLRGDSEIPENIKVSNTLDVLMRMTSDCAIVYEPDYDDVEDLFKSCFEGKNCKNLDVDACDYLDEILEDVMGSMMMSESDVSDWRIEFLERDDGVEVGILEVGELDKCEGGISGAQRNIISRGVSLVVRLRVC